MNSKLVCILILLSFGCFLAQASSTSMFVAGNHYQLDHDHEELSIFVGKDIWSLIYKDGDQYKYCPVEAVSIDWKTQAIARSKLKAEMAYKIALKEAEETAFDKTEAKNSFVGRNLVDKQVYKLSFDNNNLYISLDVFSLIYKDSKYEKYRFCPIEAKIIASATVDKVKKILSEKK
uniref:DUF1795 domain-containing protein n=1 Tax=Ditylenchus dipsaci TaxID=166011 RepID=A0A915CRG0_9BILA